jgi:hypothetical protein
VKRPVSSASERTRTFVDLHRERVGSFAKRNERGSKRGRMKSIGGRWNVVLDGVRVMADTATRQEYKLHGTEGYEHKVVRPSS